MSSVKAGQAYVEINGDPRKLFATLSKVQRQIGQLGSSVASAGSRMAALGGSMLAPVVGAARAFSNVGSALFDMSQRTGVATESLSVLQFAANQTGTDMAGVEAAVRKMQKAIYAAGNGSKEAAEALAMVGLSASDLAGLTADQQMGLIADGLMAIEDDGTRAAVAMALFGRSGTAILPMLDGGSAAMAGFAADARRLGLVMDSETAEKADALGDAIDSLMAAMHMAFIQVGSAVAPSLTQIAETLATVAAGVGKFVGENQQLVIGFAKTAATTAAVGGALFGLGSALQLASFGFGGLIKAASFVVTPIVGIVSTIATLVASFVSATAGVIAYSAASVAAAAASGTAWAIANAPLLALVAVLGAVGAVIFSILGGFEGITSTISGGFNASVSSAATLLGDLGKIASSTFNGIYDAIADGDLAGAMDILWAGLYAGWLRGVESIMGAIDSFTAFMQDVFSYMWANIKGVFGDAINWILGKVDDMILRVQKSWNYVQSFIRRGFDLEAENNKVQNAADARRREREAARGSGVETAKADAASAQRAETNRQRAAARREQTNAQVGAVEGKAADAQARRALSKQYLDLLDSIQSATTLDQILDLYRQLDSLSSMGLSESQVSTLEAALEDAQMRIQQPGSSGASGSKGGGGGGGVSGAGSASPAAVQSAASSASGIQSEIAGTFSALAAGELGMQFSIQQRQLTELQGIHKEIKKDTSPRAAA